MINILIKTKLQKNSHSKHALNKNYQFNQFLRSFIIYQFQQMIRSTKVLFPCLGSSLHAKIKLLFSIESKLLNELDKLQQKSYIAQIMMKEISRTDRPFSEIKERSLTQHLIETVQAVQKQKNLDEEITKDMLRFFTTGITPDFQVFNQERHKEQIFIPQLKKRDDEEINLQNPLIRFFPTTLISGQVFRHLLKSTNKYQVLTGHSGISKSMSVQLFWYLSNIICEYKCKKHEHRNPKIQLQQILKNVPKLIYWNVIPEETPEQARTRILKQFFEIGDDLQASNYLKYWNYEDPTKFYRNRGIKTKLLIDQFNLIANLRKEINSKTSDEIRKIQKTLSSERTDKQKMELEAYQTDNRNILDQMHKCKGFLNIMLMCRFDSNVYLSSVQIQHHLLEEFPLNKSMGKMCPLRFVRLRFEELTSTRKALYEFIDYFLFELSQKFEIPFLKSAFYNEKEAKKRYKKYIFQKLFASTTRVHLTPLLISEKINLWLKEKNKNKNKQQSHLNPEINQQDLNIELQEEIKTIQNLMNLTQQFENQDNLEIQSFEIIANSLTKLFTSCLQYGSDQFKRSVQNFLQKGSKKHKIAILAQMLVANGDKVLDFQKFNEIETYEDEPDHYFSMNITSMIDKTGNNLKLLDKAEQIPLDISIDKKLFHYVDVSQQMKIIYSYYNYSDIEEFIGEYKEEVNQFLMSFGQKRIEQLVNKTSGDLFQSLFVELVSTGKVNLSFPNIDADFKNIYNKKLGFVPIRTSLRQGQKYSFFESFNETLNYLHKINQQFSVLVPLKPNKEPKDYLNAINPVPSDHIDHYSPSIDLIMVKLPKSSQQLVLIFAFELTVSKKRKQLNSKFKDFWKRYQHFNDTNKYVINGKQRDIKLNYCVITAIEKVQAQEYLKEIKNELGSAFSIDPANKSIIIANQTKLKEQNLSPILSQLNHINMGQSEMKLTKAHQNEKINVQTLWFFEKLRKVIQKRTTSQKGGDESKIKTS